MDTTKENKRIMSITIPFFIILLLVVWLISDVGKNVFAQDSQVDFDYSSYDIRKNIFDTDTEIERSSRKPKIVYVKKNNYVHTLFTIETDINKILQQYKIDIASNERIVINTPHIQNGSFVNIIRTETVIQDIISEIPFETEIVESYQRFQGEKEILQKGVLGIRTKRVQNYYEDGILKESIVLAEEIVTEPVKEIIEIGTSTYSLDGIEKRGYNCPYWHNIVDSGPYTDEEKEWLKYVMYCESGCNAESQKSSKYKGLFQWDPIWWKKQFSENIFDGHAQIRNTIEKYRNGGENMWPNCNKMFEAGYRYSN